MNLKYILGAAALSLLLTGTAYPQEQKQEEKPAQQQEKPAESAKQPKTQQKQQQQEQKSQQKEEKQSAKQQNQEQRQTEQSGKQREDQQKQQKQVVKQQQEEQKQQERQQSQVAKQQQRNDQEQRTDERGAQRSDNDRGDHGRRIPDDKFRASFGREHHFHSVHADNHRFSYGGYWFTFNEAWPVGWAYTDDFYIDFIDGQYYLIDLTHPGIQLLLVID